MRYLSKTRLTLLDLSGCSRITSEGLTRLPDTLQHLYLRYNPNVTTRGLAEALRSRTKLIGLDLKGSRGAEDAWEAIKAARAPQQR